MWRRRTWIWTVLGLLCPLALGEDDYIPSAALQEAGWIKSWQLRLPVEQDQQLIGLYLVDDQLYLATDDGYVFAVHAETGANRWLRRITSEGYRVTCPCHSGERVLFATPTTVLQLKRLSGEGLMELPLQFPAGTAPLSDGPRLFLGGLDRRVYAFEVQDPVRNWAVIANGPIRSRPVVYGTSLFFASDDGSVYSCTARDKALRWQNYTYGTVSADLAVSDEGVYVASYDRSLYLFDLTFGRIRWRARFSGPLYEGPVLTPELAYQYCPDDGLVAVETAVIGPEERLRWKLPRGRQLLTVDESQAYVLTKDGAILVVNIQDGEVTRTLPAAGFMLGAPAPERATIYVASPDGRLFCARPRGTPVVRKGDLRAALMPAEEEQEEPTEAPEETAQVAEEEQPERLGTGRKGVPIGGKSKVSKNYGKQEGSGGGGSQP